MKMFESAYMLQNKRTGSYIKFLFIFLIIIFIFMMLYEYPKTIYYKGIVTESDGEDYVEILSRETSKLTNVYMKLIIDNKKYKYKIHTINPIHVNTNLYYQVLLDVDKDLITNEEVSLNIYLGKTTLLEELIKNIKKGIIYGQT